MRQAIHIFLKDVRGHWYEIAITLAVTAAFSFTGAMQSTFWRNGGQSRSLASALLVYVLPLAWWILIARVIHSESLPGDRQFWLTRPYRKSSLLGAKALLVLLCINVPMLIADAIIVSAYDFPIAPMLPGLLWRQVLLTAVFILPAAALSALTTGFVQLALTLAAIGTGVLAWTFIAPGLNSDSGDLWFTLEWIRTYYQVLSAATAALAIVAWQYARRKTAVARILAVAAVILIAAGIEWISWPTAFWIQARFSQRGFEEPAIAIHFDQKRSWSAGVLYEPHSVRLYIPLTVRGVPSGTQAMPIALTATIGAPDRTSWKTTGDPPSNVVSEGQLTALRTEVDKAFYERVKDQPVTIRGTLYFALFGHERITRLAFQNQFVDVPGAGRCTATQALTGQSYFVLCDSAFRSPKDFITMEWMDLRRNAGRATNPTLDRSGSPFPADLGINPIYQYSNYDVLQGPASAADVHTMEPLAYVKRDFEIDNLRLSDLERH
jgi:hypothetical protein